MSFKCSKCDNAQLFEIMINCTVVTKCGVDKDELYYPKRLKRYSDNVHQISDGEVDRYQCYNGHIVKDWDGEVVSNADDLLTVLRGVAHSHDDIVAKLTQILRNLPGSELEDIANEMLDEQVVYDGDSLFKMIPVEDACPGCGCKPGEGKTKGCKHPDGCGYE